MEDIKGKDTKVFYKECDFLRKIANHLKSGAEIL
jgi:hypothetical protein